MAIFHRPRHYQGAVGLSIRSKPFWEALYDAGADLVVNAHHHLYERYLPLTPDGRFDPTNGIRQIIVGTGGTGHDALLEANPNVAVRDNTSFGVLKLILSDGLYEWEFVPVDSAGFSDSGRSECSA